MTDTPSQPEDPASAQDMGLEAQLDSLLHRLEQTDPDTVPSDLRETPAAPASEAPAPEPQAEPEPETEPISETPPPKPEPVAAAVDPTQAQAGEKKTISKTSDVDLESIAAMAADLIDKQINQTIETASAPAQQATPDETQGSSESPSVPEPAVATPPAAQGQEAAEPQAPAEPPAAAPVALSEDDLASQIESLLNNVKEQGVGAVASAERDQPAQEVATAPPTPQPVAADPSPEVPPEAPPDIPQPTGVGQASPAPDPGGVTSIDDIDTLLAASAEQAIEQDSDPVEAPEPSAQVPGTDELLAAQAQAQPQTTEPQPAPVSGATAGTPGGSTAQDVAEELDQDAQQPPGEPVAVDGDLRAEVESALTGEAQDLAVVINASRLRRAERTLRRVCGTINKPLGRLSPEIRDTVGYVGVLTMAVALFVIAFGVLF